MAVLYYLAALKLALHFLTNSQYGYFRDELYYIDCGEHLDWGYVDQSPLIAVVAKATRVLLGDSLFALRFFPAVAGALLVLITGLMVRELGGNRFAQVLAALCVIIAPAYLFMHTILTMNAFEPLFWMLCAYLTILIVKNEKPKFWLLFGLVAGIGLMNKHSMLFFGFALIAGLLLTPFRRIFLSRWVWLGGLIAFLIFLPNIIWQIKHGFPTIELLRNVETSKNYLASPFEFFGGQIVLMHPLTLPVWLAGLYFYLVSERGKQFRFLGWTYLILLVVFIVLHGKVYYLAPVYPMLFASGAVAIQNVVEQHRRRWLKPAIVSVLIAGGIVIAPLALPVLPIETFIRYANFLGVREGVRTEKHEVGRLPQHYADMFGWENITATVARVYASLSPEEQAKCVVFAQNFGEAGAIDFFGRAYHLPQAISGHQNYYLWGTKGYSGEVTIIIGGKMEDHQKVFSQVEEAAIITSEYAMPYENNLPVYVCRAIKAPLNSIWPQVKHYN
ncbi:MAG: hypothetical protein QOJ02_3853 [Acidobacteriota bacterium]|jgi:hypothetical protein|nr:hypothetical protein [Acidobacteriota bacterium]